MCTKVQEPTVRTPQENGPGLDKAPLVQHVQLVFGVIGRTFVYLQVVSRSSAALTP